MATRGNLLEFADISIRRHGFAATTYGDLAQFAGIRKASVHHHFPAKADLGLAVLERHARSAGEALAAIADGARTGAEALRGLVALGREQLGSGDTVGLLTALSVEQPALPPPMQRQVQAAIRQEADWLEDLFRRGRQDRSIAVPGDLATEALSAVALLRGAQLLARATGSVGAFETALVTLVARTSRH